MSRSGDMGARTAPAEGLLHPVPILALVVLIGNDHWGKGHLPDVISGKLSDFAGLLFFPLVLQALFEVGERRVGRYLGPRREWLVVSTVITGVVFTAINLLPAASALYEQGLGALQWAPQAIVSIATGDRIPAVRPVRHWSDPTDLLALPMLLGSYWVGSLRLARA